MKKFFILLILLFITICVFLGLSTDSLALTSTEQTILDNAPNYEDITNLVNRNATYKVLLKYYDNRFTNDTDKVRYRYYESESPINFNIRFRGVNIELYAYSSSSTFKYNSYGDMTIAGANNPNINLSSGTYTEEGFAQFNIPANNYYSGNVIQLNTTYSPYNSSDIISIFNYAPGTTIYNYEDLSIFDTITPPVSLTGISIQTLPTTLEYYEGENISMEGSVVVANYSDGTFETITDYTIIPTTAESKGTQTITISYNDFTTNFDITVYENQSSNLLDKILNFFKNFWDKLLHFFIPTEEQIEELKLSFTDNVLSKFNISAWSFDSESLNYPTWEVGNVFQNAPIKPPVLQIPILNTVVEYDTQQIVDFLDMPISFGKAISTHPNSDTEYFESVPTGNLTVRTLVSALLSLELFVVNICLYNKFFNKGR